MKLTKRFSGLIIIIASLGLIGCGLFKKSDTSKAQQLPPDKVVAEFEKGNQLLDDNRHEEAAAIFDRLIVANPLSNLDILILYNSGIAHLMGQDCDTAAERFRKVIRFSAKSSPTIKGRSLLRMSDVYTCTGDDGKAITALIEIMKGKYELPTEVIKAEVPSKLAAAYARMGNLKEAERYFHLAERGLVQVESEYRNPQERIQALGMTLFLMGNISQINVQTMSSEEYFGTIKALQRYLYRAVELNAAPWASQASTQIEQIYKNTWFYVDQAKPQETAEINETQNPDAYERERRVAKNSVARLALQSLQSLFAERIPDKNEPTGVKELLNKAKVEETKIRNFLATNTIGTALTPQAIEASALKRPGRVANPNPILEQQQLQRMPQKKKK